MKSDVANNLSHECYVVEIDGIAKAEYQIFAQALKASLEHGREFPHCNVRVRDAHEKTSLAAHQRRHASPSPKLCRLIAISRESGGARVAFSSGPLVGSFVPKPFYFFFDVQLAAL